MVHILLIQGAGIGASDAFVADIKRHLGPGDTIEAPAMPLADDPDAERWLPAIGAAFERQDRPFVAVGHSLGGSSLLQWLGANRRPPLLQAVITAAAPYWGEGGWNMDSFALPEGSAERLAGLTCLMLLGNADETVQLEHLALYRSMVPSIATEVIAGMDYGWSTGGAALVAAIGKAL